MQTGWADCSPEIRTQIDGFCAELQQTLKSELVGVYLHGSLAMGCFNPQCSDIDLLIVVRGSPTAETSYALARHVLHFSNRPQPMEMTFVSLDALHAGRFPVAYAFHYGEDGRDEFEAQLSDGTWRQWNAAVRHDPDLAGQIAVTRARGLCLIGAPIADVLPVVPPSVLRECFLEDCDWAFERVAEHPLYGVLNPCRAYAYVAEGNFMSKDEAAAWVLPRLPEAHGRLVSQALARYRGTIAETRFDPTALQEFAAYLRAQIAACCD